MKFHLKKQTCALVLAWNASHCVTPPKAKVAYENKTDFMFKFFTSVNDISA